MKSIFLCDAPQEVNRVFTNETVAVLMKEAGLNPAVYSGAEIQKNPRKFRKTEYIFSTWGISCLTKEQIQSCLPNLKAVFYAAGSVQHFAQPFLKCGVRVFSAWAANAVPVAEYTVAQILLANKGFFAATGQYRCQGWQTAYDTFVRYPGNYGETVGIIGAGMIGKLVIQKLKAHRLKCVVFDPFLSCAAAAVLGVEKCSLEDVFARSSVVSNHLANNAQTKGMLDYSLFSVMRPDDTFINTGRGAQVVEEDLVRILTERPDIVALLDVTDPEPPAEGHPFYALPNCYLTPHIAGSSGDEVHRMSEYMLEEYRRYIASEPCLYEVTEGMLKTMA